LALQCERLQVCSANPDRFRSPLSLHSVLRMSCAEWLGCRVFSSIEISAQRQVNPSV
jgi:hypothetical protein